MKPESVIDPKSFARLYYGCRLNGKIVLPESQQNSNDFIKVFNGEYAFSSLLFSQFYIHNFYRTFFQPSFSAKLIFNIAKEMFFFESDHGYGRNKLLGYNTENDKYLALTVGEYCDCKYSNNNFSNFFLLPNEKQQPLLVSYVVDFVSKNPWLISAEFAIKNLKRKVPGFGRIVGYSTRDMLVFIEEGRTQASLEDIKYLEKFFHAKILVQDIKKPIPIHINECRIDIEDSNHQRFSMLEID